MAEKASAGPGRGLYFIVGVLLAVVVGFGVLYFTGTLGGETKKLEISVDTKK